MNSLKASIALSSRRDHRGGKEWKVRIIRPEPSFIKCFHRELSLTDAEKFCSVRAGCGPPYRIEVGDPFGMSCRKCASKRHILGESASGNRLRPPRPHRFHVLPRRPTKFSDIRMDSPLPRASYRVSGNAMPARAGIVEGDGKFPIICRWPGQCADFGSGGRFQARPAKRHRTLGKSADILLRFSFQPVNTREAGGSAPSN